MGRNSDITSGALDRIVPASYQQTAQMAPAGLRGQYQQAKYDPRMTGLSPLVKGLSRGFIAQNPVGKPFDNQGWRRFSFLFNPSEVVVNYSSSVENAANNAAPGSLAAGATDTPIGTAGGSDLSLALLVDRTYDTWANQSSRGVMEDILQLEKMCGYSERNPYLFGANYAHIFLGPNQHWFGVINSMTVTYTSWTQYLVPNRAAINLGVQIYVWDGTFNGPVAQVINGGVPQNRVSQNAGQDSAAKSQAAANSTGKKPKNKNPRGAS